MSEIEAELCKATKIKPGKYNNRQDFLAALVRGVDKLPADDFDNLSDPAYQWHKTAVAEMDKRRDITDFPDVVVEEEDETEEISEDVDEDAPTDDEGEGTGEVISNVQGLDAPEHEGGDTLPAEVESKPEKAPKKTKKDKKPSKPAGDDRYEKITGAKDRFGITAGSKVSDAVKMYNRPEGATLQQVDEAGLGRQYNILGKLAKAGHLVQKEGKVWKVIHKDDVDK